MPWETKQLEKRFQFPENADVLRYLMSAHPSAHSDVASELVSATDRLPDSRSFCPDKPKYAYVIVHARRGVIYGVAIGMSTIALRLPEEEVDQAQAAGIASFPSIGDGWRSFNPFEVSLPLAQLRARTKQWCGVAYQYALTLR